MSEKCRVEANRLPQKNEAPVARQAERMRMGVALDGFTLHLRAEGWKECKLADLYEVAVRPAVDEETGEVVEQAHAVKQSYVAHLGGPKSWGNWLGQKRSAAAGNKPSIRRCLAMAQSGAQWAPRHQASLHFGDSHQLVDWYHAKT